MDLGIITTILVGAIGIIVAIVLAERNNWAILRKARYRVFNKDFKVEISAKKHYPEFKLNMPKLRTRIEQNFKKRGQTIELSGNGFLQVQVNNMQAPYRITFVPHITADKTGRTEAYIDYLGTLDCRYKDKNKKAYFEMLKRLFTIIEDTFDVRPRYVNYHLAAALSEAGIIWDEGTVEEEDTATGTIIRRAKNGLEVEVSNEDKATTLYDVCKDNLHRVKPATKKRRSLSISN